MLARSRPYWSIYVPLFFIVVISIQLVYIYRPYRHLQHLVAELSGGGDVAKLEKPASAQGSAAAVSPSIAASMSASQVVEGTLPSPTAAYEILETQAPQPSGFDPNIDMFNLNESEHNPAGPRPDQIVILTGTDGLGHNAEVKDIVNMALHNRREYAERHGYINHFVNMSRVEIPSRPHPVWKKLPAIIETFQTYPQAEWVWWLDLDAIIMTPEFELETQILSDAALDKIILRQEELKKSKHEGYGVFTAQAPKMRDIDLIVAQDHMTINAGSFMLRRSKTTQRLLTAWRDPLLMSHGFAAEEQDALIHVLKTNAELRAHAGIVNARVLNAFWSGWQKGDLLIHLAGCWVVKHCQRNWSAVWKQRYGTLEFPPPKGASSDAVADENGKTSREEDGVS